MGAAGPRGELRLHRVLSRQPAPRRHPLHQACLQAGQGFGAAMTALNLRLQKHLEHGTTTAGAVATLRRVTDEKGAAVRGGPRLEVTIPANNSGQGKVVPVEPGRWLVEATLP